ncbi:MAG: PAS domain-containing sensor histidine kinase [Ktedonobacteraceae bacterium]
MVAFEQHPDEMGNGQQISHLTAMQQVTDQLKAVFDAMADGVFVYDGQGHLILTNPAGRDLVGEDPYPSPSASLQDNADRFQLRNLHGDALTSEQWPVTRILQGEELKGTRVLDVLLRTLDGRDCLLNISGAPMRAAQGEIIGAVVIARDVTEFRFSEQRTHEILDALLQMAQITVQGTIPQSAASPEHLFSSRRVAQRLAELTRQVLGCHRLGLSIVEPQTEILRPLAVVGLSATQEQQWWDEQLQLEVRLGDGLSAEQNDRLHHNEVLLFDLRQPPYKDLPNPYGILTMLVAPLCLGTQVFGLLTLDYGGQEHLYTPQEIALTQAMTQLLALTLERERLQQSNVQLANLIAVAHDAIIVCTPDWHITFWNQGAERLYGWSSEQAIGQITHVLLQTRHPIPLEQVERQLAEEGQWEGELVHRSRDGETIIVESRHIMVRDEAGQPTALLEINRDITGRTQLLNERIQAEANEQAAKETARLMDEFLGIVGHELRTPLTTIKGSIQLAKRNMLRVLTTQQSFSEDTDRYLHLISESLDRVERQVAMQNRLISDLLDTSRIHANQLKLTLAECDLLKLVGEVVDDQRFLNPARTIDLLMPDANEVRVLADADRLRQVVQNYLSNALKYSAASTPVSLRIEQRGAEVYVLVVDQGPGLSPEEQQRIWTRFYRVAGIVDRSGSGVGLGLGLYICRTLIERQGGQVGLTSHVGAGSTFWFSLPLL